jgi:ketosteroid isomerase-like protein
VASAHELALGFIAASEAGVFPEELVQPDLTAWTTLQSTLSLAKYGEAIAWMRQHTGGTLKFAIDAITAEGDRAVIEAHSTATLVNGEAYTNTYVFVLGLRDGKIAEVREHFNALTVMQKLVPLMQG